MHTEGQQPRDGWLWGGATPVVDGNNVCLQTGRQYADDNKSSENYSARLSWHKSKADNKAKMNDWDGPNRAVPMGRLKFEKKKKLGPTDRQSGSVQTMTYPGTRTRTA